MKYRKLRIAWSVAWGILAVLLCVLWVRSYWWADEFRLQVTQLKCIMIHSSNGTIETANGIGWDGEVGDWHFLHEEMANPEFRKSMLWWGNHGALKFAAHLKTRESDNFDIQFPHWLYSLIISFIAAAPWLPYRFSLRTLLIATTLIAVVLGMIVWMS